jgi:hypothetical protein
MVCKKCHDIVTGFFDRYNPPKTEAKLKWINTKRMETMTAVSVRVINIKQ